MVCHAPGIDPKMHYESFTLVALQYEKKADTALKNAILAAFDANKAKAAAEKSKAEANTIEAALAASNTNVDAEHDHITAKVEAAKKTARDAAATALEKNIIAFKANEVAKSLAKKASKVAWSAENMFFFVNDEQVQAEIEAQDRDDSKVDETSISQLGKKYAIKIIQSTEYSNKDLTYPRVKIIRHIFKNSAYLECMRPKPLSTTFLAINQNHTIVGLLHAKIKDGIFYICTKMIGKNFQEIKCPKEQIERRLFLKALDKAKELSLELFYFIDFPVKCEDLEEAANRQIATFAPFNQFGIEVTHKLLDWGKDVKRLTFRMNPQAKS